MGLHKGSFVKFVKGYIVLLTQDFWEDRWRTGSTGWDLGAVSPPLKAYIDQILPEHRHLKLLIPGCGNGYEAVYLLQQGFTQIAMLDIAPSAVEGLGARLDRVMPGWKQQLQLICGDFFTFSGAFDLILEQTFFCALDPILRPDYALKMRELLAPGGKLAGVLFDRDFEGGPPFGGHSAEYRTLFQPYFNIKTLAPCYNSAKPREGAEVFMILEASPSVREVVDFTL